MVTRTTLPRPSEKPSKVLLIVVWKQSEITTLERSPKGQRITVSQWPKPSPAPHFCSLLIRLFTVGVSSQQEMAILSFTTW